MSSILRSPLAALLGLLLTVAPASTDGLKQVRRLEVWARSSDQARAGVEVERARDAVDEALRAKLQSGEWERLDRALLGLLGAATTSSIPVEEADLAAVWRDGLHARLSGRGRAGTLVLITDRVLPGAEDFSRKERIGACEAMRDLHHPRALAGLVDLATSLDEDPSLRDAAAEALVGWPDVRASDCLMTRLNAAAPELGGFDPTGSNLRRLSRHLRAIEDLHGGVPDDSGGWSGELSQELLARGMGTLVHADWRIASHGVPLARFAPRRDVVPILIEALGAWQRREELASDATGLTGLRRMQHELTNSLESITGKRIGPRTDRWRAYWRTVRHLPELPEGDRTVTARTEAGFFGLPWDSGAVAFVIDASGSMDYRPPAGLESGTGTDIDRTRYDVAVRQLGDALANAPDPTAFQVVLFSDRARVWRREPTLADEDGRDDVDRWLNAQHPDGGTHLATGLNSLISNRELSIDTVIVLCDGETVEGSDWARSWLDRYGHPAGLRFHCVQVGGHRANALRTLADETGGRFVRLGS